MFPPANDPCRTPDVREDQLELAGDAQLQITDAVVTATAFDQRSTAGREWTGSRQIWLQDAQSAMVIFLPSEEVFQTEGGDLIRVGDKVSFKATKLGAFRGETPQIMGLAEVTRTGENVTIGVMEKTGEEITMADWGKLVRVVGEVTAENAPCGTCFEFTHGDQTITLTSRINEVVMGRKTIEEGDVASFVGPVGSFPGALSESPVRAAQLRQLQLVLRPVQVVRAGGAPHRERKEGRRAPLPSTRPDPSMLKLPLLTALLFVGCGSGVGTDAEGRVDQAGVELEVEEPIAFTDQAYAPRVRGDGEAAIAELLALGPQFDDTQTRLWHGFAPDDPYPVRNDCEPDNRFYDVPDELGALPMTIEGIVTLHPRYFFKPSICGADQRYYGSFFIEDESGGVLILRDSRVATFSYGDRVRLKARGLMRSIFYDNNAGEFSGYYQAVTSYSDFKVIEPGAEKTPIAYTATDQPFGLDDVGQVRRITGRIVSAADNNNFNELGLVSPEEGSEVAWMVSLDRELGQRNPDLDLGDVVEFTGPVIGSFGFRMIVASKGQYRKVEDAAP